MILPSVLVLEIDNPNFEEYLTTYLINKPIRVIIVIDIDFKAIKVNKQLISIYNKIQRGSSSFLSRLSSTNISRVNV